MHSTIMRTGHLQLHAVTVTWVNHTRSGSGGRGTGTHNSIEISSALIRWTQPQSQEGIEGEQSRQGQRILFSKLKMAFRSGVGFPGCTVCNKLSLMSGFSSCNNTTQHNTNTNTNKNKQQLGKHYPAIQFNSTQKLSLGPEPVEQGD